MVQIIDFEWMCSLIRFYRNGSSDFSWVLASQYRNRTVVGTQGGFQGVCVGGVLRRQQAEQCPVGEGGGHTSLPPPPPLPRLTFLHYSGLNKSGKQQDLP